MAMFKQRICLHLMILLIAALSAGCSSPPKKTVRMYAGAELPKEDIALLQPMEQASIDFVDGKKLGGSDSAEVLPGEHKLVIKVSTRTFNGATSGWNVGYTDVSFMARAGHIYEVYAHKEGRAVQAWVVDTQTGVVVGGRNTAGVPGETTADWMLQRDVQMVLRGRVVNTEVVGIAGTIITERWTVDEDGEDVEWIITFVPNPPGTDIGFQRVKKD